MRYLSEHTRIQLLELIRLPYFMLPLITLPLLFYATLGIRNDLPPGQILFNYMAFAMLGSAMFQFGVGIAAVRNDPWSIYLLSLPATSALRIGAQLITGVVFSIIFVLPFILVGLFFGIFSTLDLRSTGMAFLALIIGALAHGALGLALGYWLPARGALPITNLIYFPLSFIGGLFFSVDFGTYQWLHTYSPTGAWADLISTGLKGILSPLPLTILIGYGIVFSALAIMGYRRVEQTVYR